MAINTDKNSYTILFSIVMVVVVGALLAFVAQGLKPTIKENQRIEIQQNILYAMGVNENTGDSDVVFIGAKDIKNTFDTYIKKQLVIQGDKVTEDPNAYLIDLKKEEALAKDGNYQRRLPLFIGEKDGKTFYIIPMRGKGLWDAIWGFISVDSSFIVQGIYLDHKGETPGLGAEIKQRYFMDDFKGEEIMNGNSFAGITVAKGNNDPLNKNKDDHEVDAIAGATITGNGVTAMIKKDVRMYIPYLESINK